MATLLALPTDIIVLILPCLSVPDFLAFTSCHKGLAQFRKDPAFWRGWTRSTFRIPVQPLLEADGARWAWLYKTLRTQAHVYTWGNDECGALGHKVEQGSSRNPGRWPMELNDTAGVVGVVADVQCGGWSTVLLNSLGQLFATGVLNGLRFQRPSPAVKTLRFSPQFRPTSKDRYNPSTAIWQYSVGRSHILGLSDSGRVWEWSDFALPAMCVKSISVDMVVGGPINGPGRVTRVVAGWSGSSAYVIGVGIICWMRNTDFRRYHRRMPGLPIEPVDGYLIKPFTIPGTSHRRAKATPWLPDTDADKIGEVINHVVLDHYIVFITHLNKVFAYSTKWEEIDHNEVPVELTTFTSIHDDFTIQDIQGSFHKFGIFTKQGAVLIGDCDLLDSFCKSSDPANTHRSPILIPALQNASVISLAFGDYHYHALHANGTITSYGIESRGCGCLGLGSTYYGNLRGVRYNVYENGQLEAPLWGSGRRTVWFEEEKRTWLADVTSRKEQFDEDAAMRVRMVQKNINGALDVFGEWAEQTGQAWSRGPVDTADDSDDDGIGAYFALKISAAGWHSAALVMVDRTKAEHVRRKYLVREPPLKPPTQSKAVTPSVFHENANGEEADGEEIASPSEQLATAVMDIVTWPLSVGRWFLGLEARDQMRLRSGEVRPDGVGGERMAGDGTMLEGGADDGEDTNYLWQREPFPRFRLPGGEVMPGTVPLATWRFQEPDFGTATEAR